MSKADLHVKMDSGITDLIRRYGTMRGLSFTAALTTLAARGLQAEGIDLPEPPAEREHQQGEGT